MTDTDPDPKRLIHESYRIEGIGSAECRSIFLDWAISVPAGVNPRGLIIVLLDQYGTEAPDHPMTEVLRAGLDAPSETGRRGGRRGRSAT